jgi:hypothetical protein
MSDVHVAAAMQVHNCLQANMPLTALPSPPGWPCAALAAACRRHRTTAHAAPDPPCRATADAQTGMRYTNAWCYTGATGCRRCQGCSCMLWLPVVFALLKNAETTNQIVVAKAQ